MQRTKRSFYNVVVTVTTNVVILLTAFVVQKVLISSLGADYNGINGLFTSIISMMSLTDLGIGSAIIYHLYRPAAENHYKVINALLRFYRNSYIAISGVVLVIGAVVVFFIPQLVGEVQIQDNIYFIFCLFLADCLCSYFLSYKKSLLYAYQMNYILDGIHFFYYILQNAAQVIVLLYFRSYIAFLILKIISKCIENGTISYYIRKNYSFTSDRQIYPLDKEVKYDIIKKVKGLLFHRLGSLLVTGSDSLVITSILGIFQMNLYTNYHLIIGGLTALLNKVFETLTSSVGNFLLDSSPERRREIYKNIDFLNFWFFGCCSVILYTVLQPVIILWIGEKYLLAGPTVFALTLNFYIQGMRDSVLTFKDAAGIYHQDRYMPLCEAMINIVCSVFLAHRIGMTGIFAGTILSAGVVYLYSYPRYVCGPLFDMGYGEYYGQTLHHLIFVIAVMWMSGALAAQASKDNLWLYSAQAIIISVLVFHVCLAAVYGRSRPAKYYRDIAEKLIFKRK